MIRTLDDLDPLPPLGDRAKPVLQKQMDAALELARLVQERQEAKPVAEAAPWWVFPAQWYAKGPL